MSFEASGLGDQKPDKYATMVFKGGKVSISIPGLYRRTPYRLNSAKLPKEIDFIDAKAKENLFGIYSVEGDTLSICVGKQRPNAMSVRDEDFAILLVLKKATLGSP